MTQKKSGPDIVQNPSCKLRKRKGEKSIISCKNVVVMLIVSMATTAFNEDVDFCRKGMSIEGCADIVVLFRLSQGQGR